VLVVFTKVIHEGLCQHGNQTKFLKTKLSSGLNVCNVVEVEELLVFLVLAFEHHICVVDPVDYGAGVS